MPSEDPGNRFDGKATNYDAYRPSYPKEIGQILRRSCPLPGPVMDIGAGTGIFSELLLAQGYACHAVDPNDDMLQLAKRKLGQVDGFHASIGDASQTHGASGRYRMITAAQSFHWFDPVAFRKECLRLLQPGGQVAILWNDRDHTTEFGQSWEEFLLKYSSDYADIDHRKVGLPELEAFYGHHNINQFALSHIQAFDRQGLHGRYHSCSYALPPDHPSAAAATRALDGLFDAHADRGQVQMQMICRLYIARLR